MKFGPNKRASLFVDSVLTPVSIIYCGTEYIKDTPHFLTKLSLNEDALCKHGVQLFTLDVKALYPSINQAFIPTAISAALDAVSDFSPERKNAIISLATFAISNAVVHFRDSWFKAIKGLPTGASDSVCLANIYMKWVLIKFFSSHSTYKQYLVNWVRFIDDIFGGWIGTVRQFKQFVFVFNNFAKIYGIYFDKEQFGDTVHFLDVTISNNTGIIVTDLYVKPTDAHRFLHRSSFHPQHTFHGIPFSQMRRAMVICSNSYLQEFAIDNMVSYFIKCGYERDLLLKAKEKALGLSRNDLLRNLASVTNTTSDTPLVFVLPYSVEFRKKK